MKKRILISVWNKDVITNGTSDLLGCTSFGIRHIQTKHKVSYTELRKTITSESRSGILHHK